VDVAHANHRAGWGRGSRHLAGVSATAARRRLSLH
jgi:hypothetical protein